MINKCLPAVGTKTLVLFSYEGTYGGDTDIAGSEFITTV